MDADGVAAEVIFPDADAITGMESPPFGAGLSAGDDRRTPSSRSQARVRTTASSSSCARRARAARRRRAGADHPRRRPRRRGDRVARRASPGSAADHDPDDVARPHAVQRPVVRPGVGRVRRRPSFPVHTHSGEAPREEMNEFIGIYLAEVVWWTHRPIVAPAVQRRVRALPGAEVRASPRARATGSPT